MKNVNVEKMIGDLVSAKRNEVIDVLKSANVNLDESMSNNQLFNTVMNELQNWNEQFTINMGELIDDNFDLSPLDEIKSNADATPKSGFFNKLSGDNWATIATTGAGLLSGFFGKPTPTATGGSGGGSGSGSGGSDIAAIMAMQGAAAAAAAAREDDRRAEEKASSRNTMIVVGVISAIVIIGGITAFVLTRPK